MYRLLPQADDPGLDLCSGFIAVDFDIIVIDTICCKQAEYGAGLEFACHDESLQHCLRIGKQQFCLFAVFFMFQHARKFGA